MQGFERQVASLRRLAGHKGVRVIAVASGKGGVGKTQVAVNLAVGLAQQGHSTLLLDADLGLANVDVLLGLRPTASLEHVLDGSVALEDVLIDGPAGLKIVPASSGVSALANLSLHEQCGLIAAFSGLPLDLDYMIVDTATGVDRGVLGFCAAATDVAVVLCDEPASITDAYALIKLMSRERGVQQFQVICNRVRNAAHGTALYRKFLAVCDRFLDVSLCHFGSIPEDAQVRKAAHLQCALVDCYPSSSAGSALKRLAARADSLSETRASNGRPVFFVERMLAACSPAATAAEVG
jgi:flagellar biosynthesis protein FlhG